MNALRILVVFSLLAGPACALEGGALPPDDREATDPPVSRPMADAGATGDAEPDAGDPHLPHPPAPAPIRDDASDDLPTWHDQVARSIDHWTLPGAFEASGYALPRGTELLAVRVVDGLEAPGYAFYEAGGGAFSGDFWPASTIKLLAAVGALERTAELGFTSDAHIAFDSGYESGLAAIVDRAIRISSNADYDRTVRIAGLTRLNDEFLTPERGFIDTAIQSSYSGMGVTSSPGITFIEGSRSRWVPGYTGAPRGRCPGSGTNCTTLFELFEGARRVLLDEELPPHERFAIDPRDLELLRRSLCEATPSFFASGVSRVLGPGAAICHKPGWVPSRDCLDHGMIVDPATGERIFLAAATPANGRSDCPTLAPMAEEALLSLLDAPPAMVLGPNGGVPIAIQLDVTEAGDAFTVDALGADRLVLHVDGRLVGEATGDGRFDITTVIETRGERLVGVQAFAAGVPIGRRTARLRF